jgi:hypothetical protein
MRPSFHRNDAVGDVEDARIMRHHQDRHATAAGEVAQQANHIAAGLLVEGGGRLVREDEAGWPASARATATRWRWPPESWSGRLSHFSARPTAASISPARARRSRSLVAGSSSRAIATFCGR